MSEKVVHKAHPREVPQVLSALRQAGLSPVALDKVDPYQRFAPRGAQTVRIAVPRDEAKRAKAVLRQWREGGDPVADAASRDFLRQAWKAGLWAGGFAGLTAVVALAGGQRDGFTVLLESLGIGVFAGVIALVVIACR